MGMDTGSSWCVFMTKKCVGMRVFVLDKMCVHTHMHLMLKGACVSRCMGVKKGMHKYMQPCVWDRALRWLKKHRGWSKLNLTISRCFGDCFKVRGISCTLCKQDTQYRNNRIRFVRATMSQMGPSAHWTAPNLTKKHWKIIATIYGETRDETIVFPQKERLFNP